MRMIALVFLILFFVQSAFSAEFITYTTTEGLPNDTVNAIVADFDGNIWVGTDNGIGMYDGTQWFLYDTTDGLPCNSVHSLAIGNDSCIWAGTQTGGVCKYSGSDWITYDTTDGLSGNYVKAITIDKNGKKWFGTWGDGISSFDGKEWQTYTSHDVFGTFEPNFKFITDIGIEGDTLWFSTYAGACSFNGADWNTYNVQVSDGFWAWLTAVEIGNSGGKWFGTTEKGVSYLLGEQWITYDVSDGLPFNRVDDIAIDNAHTKWFATGGGVGRFDGTNWKTYDVNDGLVDNDVNAICIDSSGNKWFATHGGVSVLIDSTITSIKGFTEEYKAKNAEFRNNVTVAELPNKEKLSVSFSSAKHGRIVFAIYDLAGALVCANTRVMNGSRHCSITIPTLAQGNYLISIRTKERFFNNLFTITQ